MKWSDRLYFGTWQLGGQFKNLSKAYIESLLLFAISSGIRRFDTASVYGGGRVEEMLGAFLPKNAVIVTKIPAVSKPNLEAPEPIQRFYSRDGIHRSVYGSLERLQRSSIDAVLLHNWLPTWSSEAVVIFECLEGLKDEGIVKRVGISLPDNFSCPVAEVILPHIDVIEAPFNTEQPWVLQQLPYLLDLKKEVLLRSLFKQGKLLTDPHSAELITQNAFTLGTSVVIGMTTEKQITRNINSLKGEVG
jgi:aryl-alcohol dehydrogenase-like predicted oxidoreductase